jgi:hypothetical protein
VPRAEASVTEEPDAGKLHVRICVGAPGNGRSYHRCLLAAMLRCVDAAYTVGGNRPSAPTGGSQ